MFNPGTGVDPINIASFANHTTLQWQVVVYRSANVVEGAVNSVGGLTHGQAYTVIEVDDTTIQLASIEAPNTALALTAISGTSLNEDTLTINRSFTQNTVDFTNKQLVFASNPSLNVGQAVVYNQGVGNPSFGLVNGQTYYVLNTGTNIGLSVTRGGAPVTLSDPGTIGG